MSDQIDGEVCEIECGMDGLGVIVVSIFLKLFLKCTGLTVLGAALSVLSVFIHETYEASAWVMLGTGFCIPVLGMLALFEKVSGSMLFVLKMLLMLSLGGNGAYLMLAANRAEMLVPVLVGGVNVLLFFSFLGSWLANIYCRRSARPSTEIWGIG